VRSTARGLGRSREILPNPMHLPRLSLLIQDSVYGRAVFSPQLLKKVFTGRELLGVDQ